MNRPALVLLAIALACAPFAYAEGTAGLLFLTQNKQAVDSLFVNGELKQEILDSLNASTKKVPPELLGIFGDKKMNVYVQLDDGTVQSYWISTEKGAIKQVLKGARDDASAEIKANEATVERIALSNNPMDEFIKAFNAGDIQYNGLDNSGKVESIVLKALSFVAGLLSGIVQFLSGLFK